MKLLIEKNKLSENILIRSFLSVMSVLLNIRTSFISENYINMYFSLILSSHILI